MKNQTTYKKMTNAILILFSAVTMMACSKNSSSPAPVPVSPYGFNNFGPSNCPSCAGFAQGPVLFQGGATDPANGAFQITSAQVMADAAGYQQAAAQGLRPLVNGSYPAAVQGVFHLNVPVACGNMTYPVGDYQIQMLQMGTTTNGVFYAPSVVLNGPVAIQPAAVAMILGDANLDNVADRGSLFRVGFCGVWMDMNTL